MRSTHTLRDASPVDPERRTLFRLTAASGASFLARMPVQAATPPSERTEAIRPQPDAALSGQDTTADIIVETLIAWQVPFVFGLVGDGINSFIEALRKRQDRIRFVGVRHEESAAFMATAYAKYTGRLGVCLATTGPGAIHLMNGLYDAHLDGAPVLALIGTTFHDLIGTRFQQGIDAVRLMSDVALYNTMVTGPGHALIVSDLACRAALGNRGVAHLTVPKDVQMMRLDQDRPSAENHGARTSSSWLPEAAAPPIDQLRRAADLLTQLPDFGALVSVKAAEILDLGAQ